MVNMLDSSNSSSGESKFKQWLKRNAKLVIRCIIGLVLFAVILCVVIWWDNIVDFAKRTFSKPKSGDGNDEQPKESFLSNNMSENEFVNTYIDSSLGTFIGNSA